MLDVMIEASATSLVIQVILKVIYVICVPGKCFTPALLLLLSVRYKNSRKPGYFRTCSNGLEVMSGDMNMAYVGLFLL